MAPAPAERLTTSANSQWPSSVTSDGTQVVLYRTDADDGPRLDAARRSTEPSRDATAADAVRRASGDHLTRRALAGLRVRQLGAIRNLRPAISEYQRGQWQHLDRGRHAAGLGARAARSCFSSAMDGALMRVPVESHCDDVECRSPDEAAGAALLHRRRKPQSFVRCLARRPALPDDQSGERRSHGRRRPTSSSSSILTRS